MSIVKYRAANLQIKVSDTMDDIYCFTLDTTAGTVTATLSDGTAVGNTVIEDKLPGATAIALSANNNQELMNNLFYVKYGVIWYITEGILSRGVIY